MKENKNDKQQHVSIYSSVYSYTIGVHIMVFKICVKLNLYTNTQENVAINGFQKVINKDL